MDGQLPVDLHQPKVYGLAVVALAPICELCSMRALACLRGDATLNLTTITLPRSEAKVPNVT
jgi:hypothetical protein